MVVSKEDMKPYDLVEDMALKRSRMERRMYKPTPCSMDVI
jgi:hypothetical protein